MKTLVMILCFIVFGYQSATNDLDKAVEIIKKINCELPGAWTLGAFETGNLQEFQLLLSGHMDMLDSLMKLPDIKCIITRMYNHSCEKDGANAIHMLFFAQKDSETEPFVRKLFMDRLGHEDNAFFETKNFVIQFDFCYDFNETCQDMHPIIIETLRKFFKKNYRKL